MNKKTIVMGILLLSITFVTGADRNTAEKQCVEAGGRISTVLECNGDRNKICVFPNGEVCYIENVRDGKCMGKFAPRVLCDGGNEK